MNKDRQQFRLAEFYVGGKLAHGMAMLPDYLTDLNAIHDVEKKLTAEQAREYHNQLRRMGITWLWHSKPNQKVEALLKALDLWETE